MLLNRYVPLATTQKKKQDYSVNIFSPFVSVVNHWTPEFREESGRLRPGQEPHVW